MKKKWVLYSKSTRNVIVVCGRRKRATKILRELNNFCIKKKQYARQIITLDPDGIVLKKHPNIELNYE